MAITARQFEQLSEMGISLWQSRTALHGNETEQKSVYLPQNQQRLTNLTKQTIFSDILRSLNLTVGEVNAKDDHLDAGLFNWYFLDKTLNNEVKEKSGQDSSFQDNSPQDNSPPDNSPPDKVTIRFIDNKLISPDIGTIAQSAKLKKQLWHTIANNLL